MKIRLPALSSLNVHDRCGVHPPRDDHALITAPPPPPKGHLKPGLLLHGRRSARSATRNRSCDLQGRGLEVTALVGSARTGAPGSRGPREPQRSHPAHVGTPVPGAREEGRDGRRNPAGRLLAGCRAPAGDPVESGSTRARRPCPRPHPTPGLAGPPRRPYPRHDAQDGVRLPDQRMGVESAPGFARSIRTPFHRACTRAVPPAPRAPPARARARRPRPLPCSRGRLGLGLPRGGVVRGGRGRAWAAGACLLQTGPRAPLSLVW